MCVCVCFFPVSHINSQRPVSVFLTHCTRIRESGYLLKTTFVIITNLGFDWLVEKKVSLMIKVNLHFSEEILCMMMNLLSSIREKVAIRVCSERHDPNLLFSLGLTIFSSESLYSVCVYNRSNDSSQIRKRHLDRGGIFRTEQKSKEIILIAQSLILLLLTVREKKN